MKNHVIPYCLAVLLAAVFYFSVMPLHAKSTSCVGQRNGAPCDDGNDCTGQDSCSNEVCIGRSIDGGSCDDGNDCTGADACSVGVCLGRTVIDGTLCNDGNSCTGDDACFSGSCLGRTMVDGTPCDDGDVCSEFDICASGECVGNAISCDDGDPCTNDICKDRHGSPVCTNKNIPHC